MWKN
jgi:hypothetical protein